MLKAEILYISMTPTHPTFELNCKQKSRMGLQANVIFFFKQHIPITSHIKILLTDRMSGLLLSSPIVSMPVAKSPDISD